MGQLELMQRGIVQAETATVLMMIMIDEEQHTSNRKKELFYFALLCNGSHDSAKQWGKKLGC